MVFYEITKNAVREAMASPRELSIDLVNAQQARRALDYLVGFNLSPLLWKKVRPGLSAGRVQSPALRLICEREDEIAAFVPQEYWTIDAEAERTRAEVSARKLVEFAARRSSSSASPTRRRRATRSACAGRDQRRGLRAARVRSQRRAQAAHSATRRRRSRTSTLQQEAARKLGFSAQQHHARRAAAVRRRRHRRRRGRPDHLHAHRLARSRRRGRRRDPRRHRQDVRREARCRGAAHLSRPSRRTRRKRTRRSGRPPRALAPDQIESKLDAGPVPAVLADLEAHAWPARWRRRCSTPWPSICSPGPTARQRTVLRANGSTLVKPGYIAVYQEGLDDAVRGRRRSRAAADEGGRPRRR